MGSYHAVWFMVCPQMATHVNVGSSYNIKRIQLPNKPIRHYVEAVESFFSYQLRVSMEHHEWVSTRALLHSAVSLRSSRITLNN